MRIVIASTIVPGIRGGGTLIVDWLEAELQDRGHEVETLLLPFHSDPRTMAAQAVGLRMIDLTNVCDRVVTIRPPAHLVRHPVKVVWFIHHHRALFDLYGTIHQHPSPGPATETYRRMFREIDNVSLDEAHAVFTNSATVAGRLRYFNHLESEVLYPPVRQAERFRNDGNGDYVLGLGRLALNKRPELMIEALARTSTAVRLVIAGSADRPDYSDQLRRLAAAAGVADRTEILGHWLSEEEKVDLLAGCLAVAYLPIDEDSYGYPSLEAHHSGKAVITASDSGGTLELIEDGVNGRVVPPDPAQLAAVFDELFDDRAVAERMGAAGQSRLEALGVDWDHAIERLLA